MPNLRIQIQRQNDPNKLFPEFADRLIYESEFAGCAILESGMESGKTSLSFYVEAEGGKLILVQTSADIIKTLYGAITGAEERWAEEPVENIWKKIRSKATVNPPVLGGSKRDGTLKTRSPALLL